MSGVAISSFSTDKKNYLNMPLAIASIPCVFTFLESTADIINSSTVPVSSDSSPVNVSRLSLVFGLIFQDLQ